MKKMILFGLVAMFLLFSASAALAAPSIYIDGKALPSDKPAVVEDGRTLVPLRAIFEALGQNVTWHQENRSITSGDMWLQLDNPLSRVGRQVFALDVPAKLVNGSTYVPLRFVAESLGKDVKWIGAENRIEIVNKGRADDKRLEFKFKNGEYASDGDYVLTGTFTNTGNTYISKIKRIDLNIFFSSDGSIDSDMDTGFPNAFDDLEVNLQPGQSIETRLSLWLIVDKPDRTLYFQIDPDTLNYE